MKRSISPLAAFMLCIAAFAAGLEVRSNMPECSPEWGETVEVAWITSGVVTSIGDYDRPITALLIQSDGPARLEMRRRFRLMLTRARGRARVPSVEEPKRASDGKSWCPSVDQPRRGVEEKTSSLGS